MNVARLVLRHAYGLADKEAVVEYESGRRRNFRELADEVMALSRGLRERCNLEPGDFVGVLAKNSLEYMKTYLACALNGYVVQALNWRLSSAELARLLDHTPPKVFFYQSQFSKVAEELKGKVDCDLWIDWGNVGEPTSPFEDLHILDSESSDLMPQSGDGSDPLMVVYTGGTSGVSKGAVHTHRSAIGAMANNTVGEGITRSDKFLLMGQMFHSPVMLAINYLTHGCTVVTVNFKPHEALDAIEQERITATMGIPTMFQNMLSQMESNSWNLDSLQHMQYGGSPTATGVVVDMMEAFRCDLIQCYGRTEELAITFLSPHDHRRALESGRTELLRSCGRAAWLTEVRIIDDRDQLIALGSDEAGEIVARSPGTMVGYLDRPDLTSEATWNDGWLRTGDIGRLDDDGYLYVVDRAKDMIISGGENIYPAQVELAIQGHPSVLEVAVVGVEDELWGESVKAYVVLKPGYEASDDDIAAAVAENLGSYQKPRYVEFLEALPKTPAGKIAKSELKGRA